jgi:hypothetical protein
MILGKADAYSKGSPGTTPRCEFSIYKLTIVWADALRQFELFISYFLQTI